ncbi:MAG: glycosyltransferase family 2 protein [Acidisphaera sp.]|nr:glycosyltransferase family 2 protein [Acidisphaera sp.]
MAAGVAALTVVVPCYNERDNVARLIAALNVALQGIAWEAVFVDDDSPDGTSAELRRIAGEDARIRCIRRVGRRGLASAVIEGVLSSSADTVVVIDGDLQHDPAAIPALLRALAAGAEVAVGSRHVAGGDASGLAGAWRRRISRAGTDVARRVLGIDLADPMSGFFAMRRELFEVIASRLSGQGFKILLDVLLSAPRRLRVAEVPVRFQPRVAGESKLDALVIAQFAAVLIEKGTAGAVTPRFAAFAAVGAVGVLVHFAVLTVGRAFGMSFGADQTLATLVAMVFNFWVNNALTYRTYRLRGAGLVRGLLVFMAVCGLGAVANIGIANTLYRAHSGWTPSGILGAAVGLVWNYAVSATLVWRSSR